MWTISSREIGLLCCAAFAATQMIKSHTGICLLLDYQRCHATTETGCGRSFLALICIAMKTVTLQTSVMQPPIRTMLIQEKHDVTRLLLLWMLGKSTRSKEVKFGKTPLQALCGPKDQS